MITSWHFARANRYDPATRISLFGLTFVYGNELFRPEISEYYA